jgi:hypothetical protein
VCPAGDRWLVTILLSTNDDAISPMLHHHPDHLVDDPASTSRGEHDLALEEVLLKGLLAERCGRLDVSLSHGRS